MPEKQRKNTNNLKLRARMPLIVRVLAVSALAATIVAIGIGFYRGYGNKEFRMKGFPAELSKDVVAEVYGFERRETDGDKIKYFIKADKGTTFADNHQELENVFLQVFDDAGETSDKISAQKAVYIPATDGTKNFNAYFAGNVDIETRDALRVKTEQLSYNKETETAEADELIEFSRENVVGKSFGAIVKVREKSLELLKDVEINSYANNEADNKIEHAKIRAGHAFFSQAEGKIDFQQAVNINIIPNQNAGNLQQPTDIKSDRATAFFSDKKIKKIELNGNVDIYQKPTDAIAKWSKVKANRAVADVNGELKRLELFENVDIETTANNSKPTRIKTNYAVYEKDADKFELKNAVEIVTVEDNQPTTIRSSEAVYEQSNGKIFLTGGAEITQANDFIKGDNLTAELFPNKKLKNALARGNAFLKQTTSERATEVSGNELNATFGENQQLQFANVIGAGQAVLIPAQSNEYSRVTLSAPKAVRLNFNGGLLRDMQTEGRTNVLLTAPNNNANASNKRLTADMVKTFFNNNGKDLAKAEAVGNAELFVEPLRAAPENYRTTVNAPRFDCDFFETGNNARVCAATTNAKATRVPTIAGGNRGTQTITAERLNASFSPQTKDVERLDASGNAKFSELDRSGNADSVTFTANDETVRLRGGEPIVSDSRARARASEIDWDTRNDKSSLRGKVSTTYYSQKQTGGATPFGQTNAPVFITSETAEFDHRAEIGLYTGNARAWQENNYVRADKLILRQKEGQLYGEGAVQSLLYNVKQKQNGKETSAPVFATAQKLFYTKEKNTLRYENNVDVRQGTDRIVASIVNVYLTDKNELAQTIAENNVIITQPKRKAVGDYAQYTAADESVILRGSPARIEDSENGSSQGAQVTIFLRENRVVGESKTNQTNVGRIRSVYKVKKQ